MQFALLICIHSAVDSQFEYAQSECFIKLNKLTFVIPYQEP